VESTVQPVVDAQKHSSLASIRNLGPGRGGRAWIWVCRHVDLGPAAPAPSLAANSQGDDKRVQFKQEGHLVSYEDYRQGAPPPWPNHAVSPGLPLSSVNGPLPTPGTTGQCQTRLDE